jgi:TetR/AcrR family transcriptional regulator, cholesterol catabolism regulator
MASEQSKAEIAAAAADGRPLGVRGYRIRDIAKAEERRREILTGAARAFARAGYDATNMDQIAGECGLAKGHIYHYFRSKEEIFTEIRIAAVNRALERLMIAVRDADKNPELALRKAIAGVVARIFEEEDRYEPLLPDPVSLSPENQKRIRTLGRRYEQTFANILRGGIDRGIFVAGDAKLMTFVILRAAFTVANWYRAGGKWKPRWIVEQVTEQLVRSVLQPRLE